MTRQTRVLPDSSEEILDPQCCKKFNLLEAAKNHKSNASYKTNGIEIGPICLELRWHTLKPT